MKEGMLFGGWDTCDRNKMCIVEGRYMNRQVVNMKIA